MISDVCLLSSCRYYEDWLETTETETNYIENKYNKKLSKLFL